MEATVALLPYDRQDVIIKSTEPLSSRGSGPPSSHSRVDGCVIAKSLIEHRGTRILGFRVCYRLSGSNPKKMRFCPGWRQSDRNLTTSAQPERRLYCTTGDFRFRLPVGPE